MASQIWPLLTLLQEQTWASSAMDVASPPAACSSRLPSSNSAGASWPGARRSWQARQRAVFGGIADQDAAQQPGAVEVEQQLLVDPLEGIFEG